VHWVHLSLFQIQTILSEKREVADFTILVHAVDIFIIIIISVVSNTQKLVKNTKYMLIFGHLNTFTNTFWRWYLVFKIPNTFCVFKYQNYHDKTQQINFCYLFVSKLQVKCSLSYYVIIIIHVLSQHDISKPMLKELHPHGLMH